MLLFVLGSTANHGHFTPSYLICMLTNPNVHVYNTQIMPNCLRAGQFSSNGGYCRTCKIHTMKFREFDHVEVPSIVTTCNLHVLRTYTFRGFMPVCFAWRLLEWLWRYDGIKFGQLKAHLFIQDKKQSTAISILWFLLYWNEENLLLPFLLNIIFVNFFFLTKNTNIWCSELFDVLQYLNNNKCMPLDLLTV